MDENNNIPAIWKQKALQRRVKMKELNKRIRELVRSRDNWKGKHMFQKERADYFEKELLSIKKKLNEIVK